MALKQESPSTLRPGRLTGGWPGPGLLGVAARSAWSRRAGLLLVVLTIALSSFLLLTVERIRHDVRLSFAQSVSGTDLIVGARTGAVQLLLYSVFRIGQATQDMAWQSVLDIKSDRAVAWVVPLALGDSHRGFPVVGTTPDYLTHFRYGQRQPLLMAQGQPWSDVYDAVLGAEVAERLGYVLGQSVVLSHGGGEIAQLDHGDKPFKVVGILARTGTPVDRSVHIGLDGMAALHLDWVAGVPLPGFKVDAQAARQKDLTPRRVTAALVGLKSRAAVFAVQRRVTQDSREPLMAILPGVTLDELWDSVGLAEQALQVMGALVALVSVAALVAVVMTGLEQRRRELAVLRSVGAGPRHVLGLLLAEGAGTTAAGVAAGALLHALAVAAAGPWVQAHWGLSLGAASIWQGQAAWLGAMLLAGTTASLLPAWRAYHVSLADGLTPRE
jgi:putative ABC transport system permease protein